MDMIKYNTPQELFTAICDSIRTAMGINGSINHQDIPDKINGLINSDIINEYNELLSLVMSNDISVINNDKIENLNASFRDCTDLTTVNLPECTSLGASAFYGCTSLTTINLPECTSLGASAFNSCTSLTTINLPECTSIGEYAFYGCTSLTTVNLPKCTSVGYGAFNNCNGLAIIDLPECITINSSPHYTVGTICCENLTTVNLPKCTSIGEGAFHTCTNLTAIDLPKCTSIGDNAFVNCDLRVIILSIDRIAEINIAAFRYESSINNGTGCIYVPDNLIDEYKSTYNDRNYQFKPISELPSNLKEEYGYE